MERLFWFLGIALAVSAVATVVSFSRRRHVGWFFLVLTFLLGVELAIAILR